MIVAEKKTRVVQALPLDHPVTLALRRGLKNHRRGARNRTPRAIDGLPGPARFYLVLSEHPDHRPVRVNNQRRVRRGRSLERTFSGL